MSDGTSMVSRHESHSRSSHEERKGSLLENREYPSRPLVGVGALIVADSRIVLVRRGRPPGRGQWSIPGGLVKVGETLMAGVKREALEETALEVEPLKLVELLERIFRDDNGIVRYHYVLADYLCAVRRGELRPGSDATEAVWVARDELEQYNIPDVTKKVALKALDEVL
jgi:8-oxo-dGTP diphosphatase